MHTLKLTRLLPVVLIISGMWWIGYGCGHSGRRDDSRGSGGRGGNEMGSDQDARAAEGGKLAKLYCGSCHQYPDPGLLTRQIWKSNVLPVMSNFMGLRYSGDSILPLSSAMAGADSATLPEAVSITPAEFRLIAAYYLQHAPDSMSLLKRQDDVTESSGWFDIQYPQHVESPPFTTAIAIDPVSHRVYQGDAAARSVNAFDNKLQPIWSVGMNNIPTALQIIGRSLYVTNIGAFKPGPGMYSGNLSQLSPGRARDDASENARKDLTGNAAKDLSGNAPKIILDSLNRSVSSVEADLDNDGLKDWVVCEFGFLKGNFSWYKNMGNGRFERRLLKAVPGAIKAYVEDVNHDGKMDIWVLFGQAREGISLFINQGGGYFEEKQILTFPPVYGSSDFELVDMDGDGRKDIIYTCGDNADYSPILKPYHGVYVFHNEGEYRFRQDYFFPMYGCYKAMPGDFDRDGDMDLACISYFGDYDHHPEESFILLENVSGRGGGLNGKTNGKTSGMPGMKTDGGTGGMRFLPHTIPGLPAGRWICMDVKDLDGDGWPDIVLGNMAAPYQNRKDWQSGWMQAPPFVVLRNKRK